LEQHDLAAACLQTINAQLLKRGLMLKAGTVVEATLLWAPTSTKNSTGERDPEMHQIKKGHQFYHGMKAHIGVDADSVLVHTVTTTAANAHDITQAAKLLHDEESDVFADSGYLGVDKREEVQAQHPGVEWHVAMTPVKRRALGKRGVDAIKGRIEKIKASVRAKVEHPFRVIKRQFGHVKVRYRGLAKNTSQLLVMFALSDLWMVRKALIAEQQKRASMGLVRPQAA
jgi:transposase, IS5 family